MKLERTLDFAIFDLKCLTQFVVIDNVHMQFGVCQARIG